MWGAAEEKQLLTICSGIEIAKLLDDNIVTSASSAQHTSSVRLRLYWIDTGLHVNLKFNNFSSLVCLLEPFFF